MSFLRPLRQPYPLFSFPEAMKRDVFFGLFLTLFLLVFTPFGLDVFAYDRFYIIVGYGLVCYVTMALNDLAGYKLAPRIFNEPNWKVYHQILWGLWHLILLGLTNLIYGTLVGAFPLTVMSFFKLEFYVFASAIIPIMALTILRQNYLLKQSLHRAREINLDIRETKSHPAENRSVDSLVTFRAENGKDYFEVQRSAIVSISSQDNYVEFVFEKEGRIQKALLRSTLSKVEESLSGHTDFFRCHRAFIVNLGKIKSVEGNSQGYRIHMEKVEESIPVARPKNKAFKSLIHSRSVPEAAQPV